jgi:type II secretory pathway component PulC
MLASLVGLSLVLLVFYAAGVDPWRWWLEYQSRNNESSMRRDVRATPPGQVSVVQPVPIGTDSSVSKSRVPLILKAVRRGRNAREGYAELGVNALSPQTYRAGALLANGARIEEIQPDYIVLERGGQRVRLYVDGHAPADAPSLNSALLMVGGADRSPPAFPNSADELTDYIRVTPVYQGDTVHALEVYANERSNVFRTLGLEPGDRITLINGEAVADSASAIASLRRLTQGEALQVTVERGGHPQTISLNGLILTAARSASTG